MNYVVCYGAYLYKQVIYQNEYGVQDLTENYSLHAMYVTIFLVRHFMCNCLRRAT